MKINRDYFNNLEKPTFILCKASGDRINTIPVIEATYDEKYMDIDEASITTPLYMDNELNPIYDQIEVMKYVEIPTVGIFCIADVEISSEGTDIERKTLSLRSLEWLLGQKYLIEFGVNTGDYENGLNDGVVLYNPTDPNHSLLHLVLNEKFPDWSIGYVDPELAMQKRIFEEVSRQDIYSYLMEDIANAFDASIVFDTFNKEVLVYKGEHFEVDTNIHVSYNNLLENTSLSSSTDEIKTALTLTGADDLTIREINLGLDAIYNIDYFANTDYMTEGLVEAYNLWKTKRASLVEPYSALMTQYQDIYLDIAKWQDEQMPDGFNQRYVGYGKIANPKNPSQILSFDKYKVVEPMGNIREFPSGGSSYTHTRKDPTTGVSTTYSAVDILLYYDYAPHFYRWSTEISEWVNVNDWSNIAYNPLKARYDAYKNSEAVAMQNNAKYDQELITNPSVATKIMDDWNQHVAPYKLTNQTIEKQMNTVQGTLDVLLTRQKAISAQMQDITDQLDMNNNFTPDQLNELSTFIREDELNSSNFVVTDTTSAEEAIDMVNGLKEYGEKELQKVSQPQLTFSSTVKNLYTMPEFASFAEDFDTGKFIWVTLRDDFSVKAKLLNIHVNYFDESDFNVTFGNVYRKGKNIFTDIQDAINAATSAATSVSFNSSYWNQAVVESNSIMDSLSRGLVGQGNYISSPDRNTAVIDESGLWVTTMSGAHGKETTDNYDSIYMGGGRLLFTSDGWKTVRMSVGRSEATLYRYDSTNNKVVASPESNFGVLADFVIAGHIQGSTIVGGNVVSPNYIQGTRGTRLDLENASIYAYGTSGSLEFNKAIKDAQGRITYDGKLTVKGEVNATSGTFGADNSNKIKIGTDNTGTDSYIYSGDHSSYESTVNGFYLGNNGLSLGGNFSVSKEGNLAANNATITGYIKATTGQIGNWNIFNGSLTNGTVSLQRDGSIVCTVGGQIRWSINYEGVANFTNGTFSGKIIASSGEIGGCHITGDRIYAADIAGNEMWSINKDGQATFKNVLINGVQNGSDFAGLSYDGTNLNLGRLLTCATDFSPFGGGCVSQIQTLSVGAFEAKYIDAGHINSDYIKSSEVCADYVKTTAITSPSGEHLNIYANKLYTNSIQIGSHSYSTPVAIVVNNQHYTVLGHPGT